MRKTTLESGMMRRNLGVRMLIGHRRIVLLLKAHFTPSPRQTSDEAHGFFSLTAALLELRSLFPFRKSTRIDTAFVSHRVKEFFRQRATVRARIASHHDNNDFAHT